MTFKEIPLDDKARQDIIHRLKEEGFREEQISNMLFVRRSFVNPRGLNEIIFEVAGLVIDTDDWDKNVPTHTHMGKLKDDDAKGKASQLWGTTLEEHAFLYLKEKLEGSGWKLKRGQIVNGKEYDCLGWEGRIMDIQHPDLAVEMYFPKPQDEDRYELPSSVEKTRGMRERLKRIGARHKYVLIGITQNKAITTLEMVHSDMKAVYQRHKFGKIQLEKRQVSSPSGQA
jgi:hypothetical protein